MDVIVRFRSIRKVKGRNKVCPCIVILADSYSMDVDEIYVRNCIYVQDVYASLMVFHYHVVFPYI